MEDVLDVYARDFGEGTVPVCPGGTSKQRTKETRLPLPARPGRPAGYDFGHERNETANLFMIYAPLAAWRHVKVTDRGARKDFARVLKDLAGARFPGKRTVPVMDSLSTHRLSTLYDTFGPAEAARLAGRSGIHHTPKHGSWPSMAETGISVLSRQCLGRRIPDRETMASEAAAWQERRNATAKPVDRRFRTEDARIKLKSLYPSIQ